MKRTVSCEQGRLGVGKDQIVKSGKLYTTYEITVPSIFSEYLLQYDFSPSHGYIAFIVPFFDALMEPIMPGFLTEL